MAFPQRCQVHQRTEMHFTLEMELDAISRAHVQRASIPNIPDNVCSTDTDTSAKPDRREKFEKNHPKATYVNTDDEMMMIL